MTSRIYEGIVTHRRFTPKAHGFRYGLYMMYLDLADTGRLFESGWMKLAGRLGLFGFREQDYLPGIGATAASLAERVGTFISERTGRSFDGSIHLLTNLRHLGFSMNPISMFYCHDAHGTLRYVLAEVSNTPWNERHHYLLEVSGAGDVHHFSVPKEFHVSPFMAMNMDYRWHFSSPGSDLRVGIANLESGRAVFEASLTMQARPFTPAVFGTMLRRYPLMTLRVKAGIYWQALKLFAMRTPFFGHPGHLRPAGVRYFHENIGS